MATAGILFLLLALLTVADWLEEKVVYAADLKRVAELDADDEARATGHGS